MSLYLFLYASTTFSHIMGLGLPAIAPNNQGRKRKFHGIGYQFGFEDNFRWTVLKKPIRLKSDDEVTFDLVKVKETSIDSNSVHEMEKIKFEKRKSDEVFEPDYLLRPAYDQLVAINSVHGSTWRKMLSARDIGKTKKNLRYNSEAGSGEDGSGSEEYNDNEDQGSDAAKEDSLLEKFKKDWIAMKMKLKPTTGFWNWLGSGFYTMIDELGSFARKVSPVKLPCVVFC